MKFKNLLLGVRAPLIVAGAVAVATLVPHAKALIVQGGSYPATVCPGALSGGVQRISLPAQQIATRLVAAKSEKLTVQKSSVIAEEALQPSSVAIQALLWHLNRSRAPAQRMLPVRWVVLTSGLLEDQRELQARASCKLSIVV